MKLLRNLTKNLRLIDLEADVVDAPEQRGEIGQLQLDRVVGVDFDDAGRRFLDPVGDDRAAVRTRCLSSWLTLRCSFGIM